METLLTSQIVRLTGMIVIGLSVSSIPKIGIWFLIPWLIGWLIYDIHYRINPQ